MSNKSKIDRPLRLELEKILPKKRVGEMVKYGGAGTECVSYGAFFGTLKRDAHVRTHNMVYRGLCVHCKYRIMARFSSIGDPMVMTSRPEYTACDALCLNFKARAPRKVGRK